VGWADFNAWFHASLSDVVRHLVTESAAGLLGESLRGVRAYPIDALNSDLFVADDLTAALAAKAPLPIGLSRTERWSVYVVRPARQSGALMMIGSPLEPLIKIGLSLVLLALALEDVRHQQVGNGLPLIFSGVVMWRSVTVLPALGLLWGALLAAPKRPGIKQPRWLLVGGLVIVATGVGVRDHSLFAVLVWLLVIAQWRFNLIGGADAHCNSCWCRYSPPGLAKLAADPPAGACVCDVGQTRETTDDPGLCVRRPAPGVECCLKTQS
jgi:hypothetical protein